MTTMRWLSLSLFCIGSLGLVGSVDAEAQGKRKKKKNAKPDVEEPVLEEVAGDETKEEELQASVDMMEAEATDGTAGYDGGFYIADGSATPNRITINGRVQPRFSFFSAPST
jgi:hypothetical protein